MADRLTTNERNAIAHALSDYAAVHPKGSYAVRCMRLAARRGQAWSDTSNGDSIVAIIRNGILETVMLRRDSQPWTRAALRVDSLDIL